MTAPVTTDPATKADLAETEARLDARIDRLETKVDNLETKVDNLETKVDNLETKVDKLETKFDNLETKVDKLETKFDNLETKVDRLETKFDENTSVLAGAILEVKEVLAKQQDALAKQHEILVLLQRHAQGAADTAAAVVADHRELKAGHERLAVQHGNLRFELEHHRDDASVHRAPRRAKRR